MFYRVIKTLWRLGNTQEENKTLAWASCFISSFVFSQPHLCFYNSIKHRRPVIIAKFQVMIWGTPCTTSHLSDVEDHNTVFERTDGDLLHVLQQYFVFQQTRFAI